MDCHDSILDSRLAIRITFSINGDFGDASLSLIGPGSVHCKLQPFVADSEERVARRPQALRLGPCHCGASMIVGCLVEIPSGIILPASRHTSSESELLLVVLVLTLL